MEFAGFFSGVYGPIVKVEREDFLSELGAIRGLWNESWCVAGDFNMIRFPSERSRGGRMSPTMRSLAKVLANRMKGVLAKVISTCQNAFVERQQIMNAVLIAKEAMDSILKSNRGAILCKLDIEKAYDHVDWSFLTWTGHFF